jgi:hypothetical protein
VPPIVLMWNFCVDTLLPSLAGGITDV